MQKIEKEKKHRNLIEKIESHKKKIKKKISGLISN